MNTFAQMKKSRAEQFEKLAQAAEKVSNPQQGGGVDERFWKPTVDKAGNGSAVIRFLPAPQNETVPFVRYWDHGFQGPGGWYIEKSLTSLGQQDPVSEFNTSLWNSGVDADKDQARKQKRRLHYISNIFVISDPGNPANEGKVFLYEYGKKIFDKLNDLMHPQFEDEDAVNPFDLWEGANFRLRIRNVEGYRNYDKSIFDSPEVLHADDEVLEKIWQSQHALEELVSEDKFKTYDFLQEKLQRVLGVNFSPNSAMAQETEVEDEPAWTPPTAESKPAPSTAAESLDDDDESLDFFKKLINE